MRADRREDFLNPKRALAMMLLVGLGLLWPVPLGGALLMVTAGFGLAIVAENELFGSVTPALAPVSGRRWGRKPEEPSNGYCTACHTGMTKTDSQWVRSAR